MTHANFALVSVNITPHMKEVPGTDYRTLMFLPLSHVLARSVQQM
ncbi:hypothetical protein [Paeniglutamicibacter cryotolerans]|uniref:Long-subunit acyl-CoA synthetase (AMP-forming) n=1 Tax=Paeniglutamicibacter cryotolerans TaxID=670079 RepID=A0A839QIE8_9MICC|nr:hypothetical protein [Paeniglutamicibacter cryotolerans]MBB2995959.1 long-subunit acyl-CoA synthetase (AMP-forming) [Paeniglutamicibacter cryotolerans]